MKTIPKGKNINIVGFFFSYQVYKFNIFEIWYEVLQSDQGLVIIT